MKTQMISRRLYRLILRMHPAPFRKRFGAEMLAIFDQEIACGGSSLRILLDATRCMVLQHLSFEQRSPIADPYLDLATGSVPPRRLAQAATAISAVLLYLVLLAGNIIPVPMAHRAPARHQFRVTVLHESRREMQGL